MLRRHLARAVAVATLLAGCGGAASTASPAVDDAALRAKFVAILNDPRLHAAVTQDVTAQGTVGARSATVHATATIVLALPDSSWELVTQGSGTTSKMSLIVHGSDVFVRVDPGTWMAAPKGSIDASTLTAALAVVTDPADLAYAGLEVVDGRTLSHLVATRRLPYTPAGFARSGGGTGTLDDFNAYVETDGTPVRIDVSFSASGMTGSGQMTMAGTTRIAFRDVGGDQVIVAPSLGP